MTPSLVENVVCVGLLERMNIRVSKGYINMFQIQWHYHTGSSALTLKDSHRVLAEPPVVHRADNLCPPRRRSMPMTEAHGTASA